MDWQRDGAVTEVGWVADLVSGETPPGEMLCPSNLFQVSECYNQLLSLDPTSFDNCVNRLGSLPKTAPDGTQIINPCRQISASGLTPSSEARRQLIEQQIYDKGYNTNYTASWFLARTAAVLDTSGNLRQANSSCGTDIRSRNCTVGPLTLRQVDSARTPSSTIPLLGDGTGEQSTAEDRSSRPGNDDRRHVHARTGLEVNNATTFIPVWDIARRTDRVVGSLASRCPPRLPTLCSSAPTYLQHPFCGWWRPCPDRRKQGRAA